MEKIIVEVRIPLLGQSLDMELPAQSNGAETARQIADILESLHTGVRFPRPELLCMDSGIALNSCASLAQGGIKDGSVLMLV